MTSGAPLPGTRLRPVGDSMTRPGEEQGPGRCDAHQCRWPGQCEPRARRLRLLLLSGRPDTNEGRARTLADAGERRSWALSSVWGGGPEAGTRLPGAVGTGAPRQPHTPCQSAGSKGLGALFFQREGRSAHEPCCLPKPSPCALCPHTTRARKAGLTLCTVLPEKGRWAGRRARGRGGSKSWDTASTTSGRKGQTDRRGCREDRVS